MSSDSSDGGIGSMMLGFFGAVSFLGGVGWLASLCPQPYRGALLLVVFGYLTFRFAMFLWNEKPCSCGGKR